MLYELRIYRAAYGRMPDLHARFRDHTLTLFEKYGMTNVGYWLNTVGGHNDELWYLLAYQDMADRERAWKAFYVDPEWQKVFRESGANGPLTDWTDNRFLTPTDFSPADHGGPSDSPRLFELRTYQANQDRMPELLARFRDHASKLFEKHGITNVGYWTNAVGGRSDELLYMLAYPDMAAREASWSAFAADSDWQRIRVESNKNGNLVNHFSNRFLTATDYSPLR
ncbi:MAG: NIPSNAP family protein [Dehalococcoidia bacterium]